MTRNQKKALNYLAAIGASAAKFQGEDWIWAEDIRGNPAIADKFVAAANKHRECYYGSPTLPRPEYVEQAVCATRADLPPASYKPRSN